MSERDVRLLVDTIIRSVDTIQAYIDGHTMESFVDDQKTKDAVLMQLLVLGEAANRVPQSFRDILPDIEWTRIVRSRNIIAHDYQGIDFKVIWRIVTLYLPPLKNSLDNKLRSL